ncbi:MAG: UDP-N-acetylglucosamine 2-epimerase, partial [Candidatus Omnitrophica bacterium]|nr:UDP-N-acetylglucosamine 2-epimerase [Candidatus Omnitrophota bacterium]
EEINRVLTDRISDFLFTHSLEANANLSKEGIPADKIYFVGNVMIDTLRLFAKKAARLPVLKQFHLKKNNYALLTLHRPSNVDQEDSLGQIMNILKAVATQIPIIFPVHPRTRKRLEAFKFKNSNLWANIRLLEPLGYLDFLALMQNSRFVLTDSGGIQEETTVLGVPCLTLRKNTERPVTVTEGSNTIVGNDSRAIMFQVGQILKGRYKKGAIPALWDGKAADRIIEVFKKSYPR